MAVADVWFATTSAATLSANRESVDLPAECTASGTVGNGWAIGQLNGLQLRYTRISK